MTYILLFTLNSCVHEPFPPVPESNAPNDTTLVITNPCSPDSVYFENEILPFLISSCAQPGCHNSTSAEDNVILDNYNSILVTGEVIPFDPEESEIYETITDSDIDDRMPPAPEDPLTDQQIEMIFTWISQGAQNNSCNSCDTVNIGYLSHILPLIELKCQGCHSGGEPEAGLSLTSYTNISAIALNGSLYSSVTGSNGVTLMPFGGNPLSQCEIDLIKSWIDDGAPEN